MLTLRIRSIMWFAAGLAIAVVMVWSFTAWRASAIDTNESTFVPITPVRILDSRDPTNIGLSGPFVSAISQDLHVTGNIPTTTGNQIVVPVGSTGVVLNVTAVSPTANGFISIRPADAPGVPSTSSLNFSSGDILPNAVTVSLPTAGADAGKIEITFDAYGTAGPTTDVLIDVVGYNTNTGLQELDTRLTAVEVGQVVMSHGPGSMTNNSIDPVTTLGQSSQGAELTGDGFVNLSLTGPTLINGEQPYTLLQVEYCIRARSGASLINSAVIVGFSGTALDFTQDNTVRNAVGCYVVTPENTIRAHDAFTLLLRAAGGVGTTLTIGSVESTWELRSVFGLSEAADASASQGIPELAGT